MREREREAGREGVEWSGVEWRGGRGGRGDLTIVPTETYRKG